MKIGIAGTGKMGAAIATRLMEQKHDVTVWNRTAGKTQALAAAGAHVAATPAQLAAASEIVITILTNAAAIEATYHGRDGLLAGDAAGKLFVEMSTVRPETEKALAVKVKEKGAAMIDCPVGGSVGPALAGKLFGFAGGEAGDVARARLVLDQLCRRVEHVGAIGAGTSMKLAINLPLLVYWQALGEALSLCRPLGLDAARLMDIFADTAGAPTVVKARCGSLVAALSGQDMGPVTFDIDSVCKDLHTMVEEAQALGGELPVAAQALACFDLAVQDGLGAKDCAVLPVRWSRQSVNR